MKFSAIKWALVLAHLIQEKYKFILKAMFKHHRFPKAIILQAVFFKLCFGLSYRDVEELMEIRGVNVDHATIQRWVFKFTPLFEKKFKKQKKPVSQSWRMDEMYIKVKVNRGKRLNVNYL